MSYQQVEKVVTQLAALQSMYWDNDRLAALDWMPTGNNWEEAFDDDYWASFVENYGSVFGEAGIAAGETFRHQIHWIEQELHKAPKTICHYDLREDNMMFGPVGTSDEFILLDWQAALQFCGVYDVVRLMAGSETALQRRGHHLEILRCWYQALLDNGISTYPYEQALRDFKLCALSFCTIPVYFHKPCLGSAEERAPKLIATIAERAFATVVELDAVSVLPH